jgi:hypothetical protein
MTAKRIVIIGPPRSGKTTLALDMGTKTEVEVLHTDDKIGLGWSECSEWIAEHWLTPPGPWIVEGVAAVRALRKWLAAGHEEKPCDLVIHVREPKVALSKGQASMAKGCAKVWAEVEGGLRARGVDVETID